MPGFKKFGVMLAAMMAMSQAHAATALSATSCTDAGVLAGLTAFEATFKAAAAAKDAAAIGNVVDPAYLNKGENKAAFLAKVNKAFANNSSFSIAYTYVVCNPSATAGLEDVIALETLNMTSAATATAPAAATTQVNRQHLVLKSDGTGGWTLYGNQLDFGVNHGTWSFIDPANPANVQHGLQLGVWDPNNLIQSAVVSGPGIAGSKSLFAHAQQSTGNGGTGTSWDNWDQATNTDILPQLSPTATLPISYTLTVTEKPVGTAAAGIVTTKTVNFTAWNTNIPTALAPAGNYTANLTPTFSWAAPAAGAPYLYGFDLFGTPASATSPQPMIWTQWNNLYATSLPYAGPALTSGSCYNYNVTAIDLYNNQATTSANFGLNNAACSSAGTGGGTNFDQMFIGRNNNLMNAPARAESFSVSLRYPRTGTDNLSSYGISCPGAATVTGNFTAAGVSAGYEWVNVNFGNVQPATPLSCTSTVTYADGTTNAATATVDSFLPATAYPTAVSLAANSNVTALPQVNWTSPSGTYNYQVTLNSTGPNGVFGPQLWYAGPLTGSPAPAYGGAALTANRSYIYGVATVQGLGTNIMHAAQVFTPFCYQCTSATYNASGTYAWNAATGTATFNWTSSSFTCGIGPSIGTKTKTGVTITATTMTWPNMSWTRSSGTAGDITGTWTGSDGGNSFTATFNADGTLSASGNVLGGCDTGTGAGTYAINLNITGVTTAVTNVQVCANVGTNSSCGPNGGFAIGQPGTISITANSGSSYTITVPGNQPAAAYCSVTSGGSGVLGASMPTAVVNCSGTGAGSGGANISLVPGWNLAGNGMSAPIAVSSALGNAANVTTVWKWNAASAKWAFYTPLQADGGAAYAAGKGYDFLTTINAGEGFWVNAKASFTVPLSGSAVTTASFQDQTVPPNKLPSGWSLIAVGDNPTAVSFNKSIGSTPPATGTIPPNLTSLWAWDAGAVNWRFYAPSMDTAAGTLAAYISGHGYLNFGTRVLDPAVGFWVNHP